MVFSSVLDDFEASQDVLESRKVLKVHKGCEPHFYLSVSALTIPEKAVLSEIAKNRQKILEIEAKQDELKGLLESQ